MEAILRCCEEINYFFVSVIHFFGDRLCVCVPVCLRACMCVCVSSASIPLPNSRHTRTRTHTHILNPPPLLPPPSRRLHASPLTASSQRLRKAGRRALIRAALILCSGLVGAGAVSSADEGSMLKKKRKAKGVTWQFVM